jgi:hypothetical protein
MKYPIILEQMVQETVCGAVEGDVEGGGCGGRRAAGAAAVWMCAR